jgi:hypothetical protein
MPIDPLIANLDSPLMGTVTMVPGLRYSRTWTSLDAADQPLPLEGVDSATFRVIDPVSRKMLVEGAADLTLDGAGKMEAITLSVEAEDTKRLLDACGTPRGGSDQPQPTRLRAQATLYDNEGNGYLYIDLTAEVIAWA